MGHTGRPTFAYATLLRLTDTHPFMLTFPLVCAFLHLFGMLAFYLGHTLFASIWMTLVLLLDITVINLFGFVPSQGAEHYFIMVPALIFMVLPPQQREWQISLLTLTLALLSLCFVMPEPAEPWMQLSEAQFQALQMVRPGDLPYVSWRSPVVSLFTACCNNALSWNGWR